MRNINIKVPPELFEHYQAMEKRSYQYKTFTLENLLSSYLPLLWALSLPRQSPSTIKIIGLSYLAILEIGPNRRDRGTASIRSARRGEMGSQSVFFQF